MKKLLAFAAMLCCTTAFGQFMTKDEIHNELNKMSKLEYKTTISQDEFKAKGLIPVDKFFPKEEMAKFKYTKIHGLEMKAAAEVDLRNRDTSVKNQQSTSLCTAFAGVGAIENMLNATQKSNWDLSELDAWSYYREYSCFGFVTALNNNRICDEKYLPFNNTEVGVRNAQCTPTAHAKIIKSTYHGNDAIALKAAMSEGSIGYVGMVVPDSMMKCAKVIDPKSAATAYGHALQISGYYTDPTYGLMLYLKNSWGSACGDKGYHVYPVSLCTKRGFYCQIWTFNLVDSTNVKPTPVPSVPPTVAPTVNPTQAPTVSPTLVPTSSPIPTTVPTIFPTEVPTVIPSPTATPDPRPAVLTDARALAIKGLNEIRTAAKLPTFKILDATCADKNAVKVFAKANDLPVSKITGCSKYKYKSRNTFSSVHNCVERAADLINSNITYWKNENAMNLPKKTEYKNIVNKKATGVALGLYVREDGWICSGSFDFN